MSHRKNLFRSILIFLLSLSIGLGSNSTSLLAAKPKDEEAILSNVADFQIGLPQKRATAKRTFSSGASSVPRPRGLSGEGQETELPPGNNSQTGGDAGDNPTQENPDQATDSGFIQRFTSGGASCNSQFQSAIYQAISELSMHKEKTKRLPVSACQRAILYEIDQTAYALKGIYDPICQKMAAAKANVDAVSAGPNLDQATAQETSAAITAASQSQGSIAALLHDAAGRIEFLTAQIDAIKAHITCASSSNKPLYDSALDAVEATLRNLQTQIEGFETEQRKIEDQAKTNTVTASTQEEDMGTTTTTGDPATTPEEKKDEEKLSAEAKKKKRDKYKDYLKFAPLVGVPLAGLLLGQAMGGYGGDSGTAAGNGCKDFSGDPRALFQQLNIDVANSFDQSELLEIAAAVNTVPACLQGHLKGIKIENKPGMMFKNGKHCLPGHETNSGIALNLKGCEHYKVSTIVHELFHKIANRGNLDAKYNSQNSCPVSGYANDYVKDPDSFSHEDFCESARIVLCGSGGAGASRGPLKNTDSCAQQKYQQMQQILNCSK